MSRKKGSLSEFDSSKLRAELEAIVETIVYKNKLSRQARKVVSKSRKRKDGQVSLYDDIVSHQIMLERAKKGEEKIALATVRAIDAEIKKSLLLLPENYTKKQLDFVIESISRNITSYYEKTVLSTFENTAAEVSSFEIEFAEEMTKVYLSDGDPVKKVEQDVVLKKVLGNTYQGKKLATWTAMLGEQKRKDVVSMIRSRATEGASPEKLASGVSIAVQKSNNASAKVSNAYVTQATNVSRNEVYNQNPEWAEEIVWTSILDGRTTLTCGVRSNQRYDSKTHKPIDHDNLWEGGPGLIHWGCRSIGIPTRKDGKYLVNGEFVSISSGSKAAIGGQKGYDRGDNLNKDGKKSKIPNANNKLEIQTVEANITYESWLRRQPRAFIEDTLGVAKAAQFIDGKQSLQSFVVNNGRELTVKELKQKLK